MTALLLGALGLTLSLIVPGPLARAAWPQRAPAAAVLLWQSITLAAVLSALGVVLAAPEELTRAAGSGKPVAAAALIGALAVAAVIVLRLLVSLWGVSRRSRARRERHRLLVDLLDRAEQRQELGAGNVRVLAGNLPLAYCVPGRQARVVLSDGALRLLDREQVDAVLAHEQTHLRHRHEVVMESFTAFYRAVPAPLRSRVPLDAVHLLLEMVADDAASKRTGPAPLRGALERLTDAVPLAEEIAPERDSRRRRTDRLAAPRRPSRALEAAVVAVALALLVLPTVILVVPWLDQALAVWPL
ncbi:M56 family metallopeptidase [Actinoplanes sp. KI2]|uniref:M56 family metallopeptidase n=1 Tax=Actinoplanes sp. KI2 TaxID=2983315 RepID=UPI0021D5F701|nr:M56 family metallopeptidase [Actinoplanes sp. KI2]MCU7728618.1 M56 family metallopeptidase [Actinoplanes sp. KI2]